MIDPADPHQLDSLLRRHRITLQHRLGQNFLVDHELRDAIAEAAGVEPEDEVLEVGAGAGTLTIALAARCRRVVASRSCRPTFSASTFRGPFPTAASWSPATSPTT
ncbi:MAG: hypothetical protein E6I82_07740 [Chloroflexi bacterium]|nr:MAG: hypothetical protein E6I82_07740 [Chloroflexota bacterium]